jgi:hypothetical protein
MGSMSKMNEIMMKGMNKVMLNCDEATLAITRAEIEKSGCVERIQLQLHLMGCRVCREFARQSRLMNKEIKQMRHIDTQNLRLHLAVDQKGRLTRTIEQYR